MTDTRNHINLQVNGEKKSTKQETSVLELLKELEIDKDKVAVELNGQVIYKDKLDISLSEGDNLEIIRILGGG